MHYGYPDGAKIDWGFCVLGCVVVYYYVLLVPVQYFTITKDSEYVLKNSLDDDIGMRVPEEPHQLEEDARYLLAQDENQEILNLLSDASLSLIGSNELELVRRIGVGGFGEVGLDQSRFVHGLPWFLF